MSQPTNSADAERDAGSDNTQQMASEPSKAYKLCPIAVVTSKRSFSSSDAAKGAVAVWFALVSKIAVTLIANMTLMWVYYLPALVLSPALLAGVEGILYHEILILFRLMAFWSSLSLTTVYIFSYQFAKNALAFAVLPMLVFDVVYYYLSSMQTNKNMFNVRYVLSLLFLAIGLYLIVKSKRPETMNAAQETHFKLTKDGSPMAMFKGMIGYNVFVNFIFFNILSIYIKSSFYFQVLFRFVVFPLCFSLSDWYQHRVLMNLSKEHMGRRSVQSKTNNLYIQFIGRILISSFSTNNALSSRFILVNLASSFLEILSTITFRQRMRWSFRFVFAWDSFWAVVVSFIKRRTQTHIAPIPQLHDVTGSGEEASAHRDEGSRPCAEELFVEEAVSYQATYLFDEITSEISSLFLAPLLMYFLHPLIENASKTFQPISSFREYLSQTIIQLGFELIGDIVSLAYEIRWGSVTPESVHNWKPLYRPLSFMWLSFCVFSMHLNIVLFSALQS